MTITFVGHGYVGLVTAAVFAELGNKVWVIGHTPEKVENLKKGIIPIYEPGLEKLVQKNIKAKRLFFTLDFDPAIKESEAIFIAVGTPPLPSGDADLSVVYNVAEKIGKNLGKYSVVITKSTVPIGTSDKVKAIINKVKPKSAKFDYGSVPEFLREGQALSDTFYPDRVVIGTDTEKASAVLSKLHAPVVKNGKVETKLMLTNVPTAEMIKYASNALLAVKISYANAIAQLSELTGADGIQVLQGVGLDKRIGNKFLDPGAGYGGSCFPKDVKALIAIAKNYDYDFRLLKEVEQINKETTHSLVTKAEKLLKKKVKGKKIGVLGLAFKPDTDDMRFAPAITIVRELAKKGAAVTAYDPISLDNAKRIFAKDKGVTLADDAATVMKDADLLIIVTDWNEFKEIDLKTIKKLMKAPVLIDGRNIYDPAEAKKLGFAYVGVGR